MLIIMPDDNEFGIFNNENFLFLRCFTNHMVPFTFNNHHK